MLVFSYRRTCWTPRWRCSPGSRTGRTSPTSSSGWRTSGRRPARWGSVSDLLEAEVDTEEAVVLAEVTSLLFHLVVECEVGAEAAASP